MLVPASSWRGFDLETELPGDTRRAVRDWARRAVKPYSTILEGVQAVLDRGQICGRVKHS